MPRKATPANFLHISKPNAKHTSIGLFFAFIWHLYYLCCRRKNVTNDGIIEWKKILPPIRGGEAVKIYFG